MVTEGMARKDNVVKRVRVFDNQDLGILRKKLLPEEEFISVDSSEWGTSPLAIINCILDTFIPGCRLEVITDADSNLYVGAALSIWRYPDDDNRERNSVAEVLRGIADAI